VLAKISVSGVCSGIAAVSDSGFCYSAEIQCARRLSDTFSPPHHVASIYYYSDFGLSGSVLGGTAKMPDMCFSSCVVTQSGIRNVVAVAALFKMSTTAILARLVNELRTSFTSE
jgi:hypothetical protein